MDIQAEFGFRCKQLRARSGMSQEILAFRAGLDRTYISSVERGERNVSLVSMEKIASAFHVSLGYMFSIERFSDTPAYQRQDFIIPLSERFKYHVDFENRILSFQISGLLNGEHAEYMSKTWFKLIALFGDEDVSVFFDYRGMKASDGDPAVFLPEVAEKAGLFQKKLTSNINRMVTLCNSEYMMQQLNHVSAMSNILDKSLNIFGHNNQMIENAYDLLGINDNKLIKIVV
ncbi:helix-turn-helix domain-containing protein [Paenibacillus qinlingensis]|uniref:helix-turn-helix domain-containing protein n=1 Tax=Paenibacillus qinlingensis TaxID=1837343 RepID=UPI001567BE57|nr:helix-turn-helix transcriptional regulator [Paenibacillus qinlingensis]NQX59993.1 helix-turn-helix transcriptional regulator [Paenibacillus qinlingensis]